MKSKRILTLAILMLAVVLIGFFPKQANIAKADVVTSDIDKIAGYSYDLSYILKDAGFETTNGKTVKYRLSQLSDGTAVTEGDTNVKGSSFETAGSTIEFKREGVYSFDVYTGETTLEASFKVTVVSSDSIDETSISYNTNADLIGAVQTAVDDHAKTLKVGDSFSFTNAGVMTALEKVVVSKYFPYSALTKNYYYSNSQSSSYTNTTSSKFTVSKAGTYSFYVLVTDECNNKVTTDDLVEGPGGWYAKDSDGNRVGDVIIPIYTFTVEEITAPVITVAASEAGFLNLEYTVNSFTIDAEDYQSEYTLYYSEELFDKDDESYENDTAYMNAVLAHSTTVDVTDELFDKDEVSFTPDKKGYYYVLVRAVDSANMSEQAMSRAISVQREYTTVSIEREFVKNNLVSVISLSVALLCLVGLIVLILIKPKDYNVELEVKNRK